MPIPMPPSYNGTSYKDGNLHRNPYDGYYSYSTILDDAPGLCEAVLFFAAILLWFYSFYRLYLVWHNTLNFSEASIQGGRSSRMEANQGWNLLFNWTVKRIRLLKLQVLYDYLQILCVHYLYSAGLLIYIYIYIYEFNRSYRV